MNTNEKIHKAFNNIETVEVKNVYKPYKEQKTLLGKVIRMPKRKKTQLKLISCTCHRIQKIAKI